MPQCTKPREPIKYFKFPQIHFKPVSSFCEDVDWNKCVIFPDDKPRRNG